MASLLVAHLLTASNSLALSAETPPIGVQGSPLRVSAYDIELNAVKTSGILAVTTEYYESLRYVELQNNSTRPVNLSEYVLRVTDTKSKVIATIAFNDEKKWVGYYLPPGGFVVVSFNGAVTGAQFDLANDIVSYGTNAPELLEREFQLFRDGSGIYAKSVKLKLDNVNPQTRLVFMTVTAEQQDDEMKKVYDTPLYAPRTDFVLTPIEILPNPSVCGPQDTSVACVEYVKFYNPTAERIDFDGTRLRTGSLGQASTASNTIVLTGSIAPQAYAIFTMPLTNTGGYVWLEDTYGVAPFENTIIEYPDASAASKKGQSWALVDGAWQWATPNPGGANMPIIEEVEEMSLKSAELKPCRDDQYRNPETNRCKLISSSNSTTKPCAANQYRNPETNRCRLITSSASSSSSLKPCAANQYRNPETNRCKSLATTTSQLKPCAANQERNPATNRCRNVQAATVPVADFPVEANEKTDDQSLGWVAFAGVGVMAVGYAGWEWRYEIAGIFRKLKGLVTKT